jgi:hypothetical protein
MKKIVLLLLGLLFLTGWASAYLVNIDAPDSLAVGKPLVVTGTTTIGIGTPIDVVLYHQLTTTKEIKRRIVYVQSDKSFRTIFDTTGLEPGIYKVEVPTPSGGDSVSMRLVTLFDRSADIYLSSPLNQSYSGKISVTGEIKGGANSGVQIEVTAPSGLVVFGPQYVSTDNAAHFTADIGIPEPGRYEVSFTDAKGYIGSRTVNAIGQSMAVTAAMPSVTTTTRLSVISAHALASRDSPAYFIVETGTGPVTLYTSKSLDWVLEYIDDRGVLHMVNDQGDQFAEKTDFQGRGGTIYAKVYPYQYSVSSDVFLYGENVRSILASPTVPAPFAASAPQPSPTQESPVAPALGIAALGAAVFLARKK